MRLMMLAATAILLSSTSAMAAMPEALVNSLQAAKASGDPFVMDAVSAKAKADYPAYHAQIEALLNPAPAPAAENLADMAPAAGTATLWSNWEGSVEAGASFASGNTEEEQLNAEVKLEYEQDRWENELRVRADASKSSGVRASERYQLTNQTDYDLTEMDYAFLNLDYVQDRFSGYDYRASPTLGYGRKIVDNETLELSAEAGVGYLFTQENSGLKEEEPQVTLGGELEWELSKSLELEQDVKLRLTEDLSVTESETALKSHLNEMLYLKLGVLVEHLSKVPAGKEQTDTLTTLKLGYEF